MSDLIRLHTDERIDVPDARYGWGDQTLGEYRRLVRELVSGKFNSVPVTSTTTTRVDLRIVDVESVEGVYLATDTGKTGTNYFTGGSIQPITEGTKLTLGAALPGAATAVVVDFTASRALLRRYRVKTTTPASSGILVDRGAGIGAESLLTRTGAAGTDTGQLLGGEGQAQRAYDFQGLPPGDYWVGIQFTYTEGRADNRAFWDALLAAEDVRTVNTRWISGWNVVTGVADDGAGNMAATGGALIVGVVVWGGATVQSGDIRHDVVDALFEGTFPWEAASQFFRPLDFSRSNDRTTHGAGSLRQSVNNIQRVLEELKHYDPESGRWYTAPKFTLMNATDGVTIGDGVNQRGHFNTSDYAGDIGAAITAALASALPSTVRKRIKILPGVYSWTSQVLLNAGTVRGLTLLGSGRQATRIEIGAALASTALELSGTMSDATWLGVEIGDMEVAKLNGTD